MKVIFDITLTLLENGEHNEQCTFSKSFNVDAVPGVGTVANIAGVPIFTVKSLHIQLGYPQHNGVYVLAEITRTDINEIYQIKEDFMRGKWLEN